MGFITLGIETATGIEPEKRKTSVGVRVYLWSCMLSILTHLVVSYLGFALIYPPRHFALLCEGALTILPSGSLVIGCLKLREHTTTSTSWAAGLLLGVIVTIELFTSVMALMGS